MTEYSDPFRVVSAASDNSQLIKSGECYLTQLDGGSINDAPVYLHIYDTDVPPTAGMTPIRSTLVPSNATAANGAGSNIPIGIKPVRFKRGLGIRLTKDFLSSGTTAVDASEVIVNGSYCVD